MANSHLDKKAVEEKAWEIFKLLMQAEAQDPATIEIKLEGVAKASVDAATAFLAEIETTFPTPKAVVRARPTVTRNLLYHLTPMGDWNWGLEQLLQRIDQFNGRRVIAITYGENLPPASNIIAHLKPYNFEFVTERNDPQLRETVTFPKLLEIASSFEPGSITFYGHSKGVTRLNNPAVRMWTEALYHYNLDYPNEIQDLLGNFSVVGSFKKEGTFRNLPKGSMWHYSGTFFWFRNDALFTKPFWRKVPKTRYGVEGYLSLLFGTKQAGVFVGPNFHDGYKEDYMRNLLTSLKYPFPLPEDEHDLTTDLHGSETKSV